MIQAVCPKCKQIVSAPEDLTGGPVTCPACGHRCQVPGRPLGTSPFIQDAASLDSVSLAVRPDQPETRTEAPSIPAAELPAGLPDEVYLLGTPTAVYEMKNRSHLSILIEGVIFWALAILSLWWGDSLLQNWAEDVTAPRWRVLRLAAGLACVGWPAALIALHFCWYHRKTFLRAALVFPGELVLIRKRPAAWPLREKITSVLVFPWKEIDAVWHQEIGDRTRRGFGYSYRCTLKRRDGVQVTLECPISLPKKVLPELGDTIQREVTRCLLPGSVEIYQAGGAVDFGPLRVSHEGLGKGGLSIPWADVKSILVDDGTVCVREERLGRRDLAHVEDVPNVRLFLELARAAGIPVEVQSLARTGPSRVVEGKGLFTELLPKSTPREQYVAVEGEGGFNALLIHEMADVPREMVQRLGEPRGVYNAVDAEGWVISPRVMIAAIVLGPGLLVGGWLLAASWSTVTGIVLALAGLALMLRGALVLPQVIRIVGRRIFLLTAVGYAGVISISLAGLALNNPALYWPGLVVALTAMCLLFAAMLDQRTAHTVLVFSEGVFYIRRAHALGKKQPPEFDVFRWDQIEEIRQEVKVVRGRSGGYFPMFRAIRQDGSQVVFSHRLAEHLGDTLLRETTRCLLPRALATCQAGGTVYFGPLGASREGLRSGSAVLSWEETDAVKVTQEARPRLVVRRRDDGGKWYNVLLSQVPNHRLLVEMVKHFAGRREGGRIEA